MRIRSKMKRVMFIVIGAAMLLAGCGDESSRKSQSELMQEEFQTDKYDSYITYKTKDSLTDDQFTELAKALELRLERAFSDNNDDHASQSHMTQSDHMKGTVTIYFNNTKKLENDLVDATASPNLVQIRKGDKPDGEVVVSSEHILDAYTQQEGGGWTIMLEFTQKGREIFKKTAQQLGGSTVPVTVWIDGKALDVKLMTEPKMYGNAIVTGSFDEHSARRLAYQLRSGQLKYNVTIDVSVLNRNRA